MDAENAKNEKDERKKNGGEKNGYLVSYVNPFHTVSRSIKYIGGTLS